MAEVRWVSTAITFPVCEVFGSRKENISPNEFTGTVTLKVPYGFRFQVVWDIYNNEKSWPFNKYAFVKSFDIAPFQGGAAQFPDSPQVMDYLFAYITFVYSTHEGFRLSDEAKNKYYHESFEPLVEFQVMSPENLHWGVTSAKPGRAINMKEAPGRQVRTAVYTVKWKQQYIVEPDYYHLQGCVNDQHYLLERYGLDAQPETLMFMPGPVEDSIYWDQFPDAFEDYIPKPGYDYTVKFAYRESGWNKFYRNDSAGATEEAKMERIRQAHEGAASTNFDVYPIKDLTSLLPASPMT